MIDKSTSRIRRMFGEIAPWYDFLNHFLSGGIDRLWRGYVVKKVRPEGGDRKILDVCTGTADLAMAFWKRYRVPVVGTDFCPEMLEIGKRKIQKKGWTDENIQLLEADTCQLPFADDTFQVVSVAFGLRNVENTQRGMAEMVRVCVPGGKVAILEFSTPTLFPFRQIYLFYFRHVLPKIGQFTARNRWDAYEYLPQSVGAFPQGRTLAEMLEAAGLERVTYQTLTLGIATLYLGYKKTPVSSRNA
ncbi:MAG: bifunctional demethylmenaquinone methyltransferase/2-methoxy-6-polyprenyl-1,4-benzoquinol methylase UbiE [Planctomycetia bacterium]|nr:bifunctional demethylmenaquinone methyltransferase/2-methoxy-6-polyprenyl-1,4-benzoquinol methylase UbiE [Planctomycetia bacterium]